jgi:UDP:flavonoid glycosyltransferase YjiC (YdhE family)
VARLPLPRRGFLPKAAQGVADRLAASGMIVEPAPVAVEDITRRSRLMLNAGQHGILCLGLYAGLPQICLPQHLEQDFHARGAAAEGVAEVVPARERQTEALIKRIMAAYGDRAMATRAQGLAARLKAEMTASPQDQARAAVASLAAEVRAA